MPDRGQAGRFLRSLLTAEFVLRLAAVLLAVLVVGDALVSGTAGFWSVFLALAAVGAVWAAIWLFGRLRPLLRQAGAESDEWAAAARVAARAVTRGRARLAAVLALLVLVLRAAVSGYVGVWTILAAVTLAALATLLSSNLRVVGLLAGTAVVFAAGTVFVANMFQGSGEARALAVSVGAVVLPLVASDKLVKLVKEPALTAAHRAILAALTLMLGFLGWTRADWLPGVLHGCYTLPTSTGMTVLSATAGGDRCYGLLDNVDAGVFAAPAFGRDPVTTALERRILEHNQPLRAGDLTVVWLGALSCEPSPADATRCADGRDYPAERDQLRAMLFAQAQIRATTGHRVHVVIADAAQDVAHADDIARLLIAHRAAYGPRLVVIGGGDSRDTTQRAINRLLDAGIPFIAPNLLADLGAAGRPFVDRPGYLQLAPSNLDYAKDAMTRLTNRFPGGFRLDVYQHLDPTDQYTTSLVNDLLLTVKSAPGATARHLSSLDRIDESACAGTTSGPPTVLFFADRWTRFADFVQRIDDVCGHSAPRLVLADGSVSRFMANYQLRAVSNAPWPVDYYVGGPSCADLTPGAMATFTRQIYAERGLLNIPGTFQCVDRASGTPDRQLLHACPLDAAVKLTSQPCFPNDLGTFLAPAWDAVHLADALLPARRPAGRDYLTSLNIDGLELSSGALGTVNDGRLATPTVAVRLWHVDALDDPAHILERPGPELTLPTDGIPGTGRPVQ
jgi:hypothetical protein